MDNEKKKAYRFIELKYMCFYQIENEKICSHRVKVGSERQVRQPGQRACPRSALHLCTHILFAQPTPKNSDVDEEASQLRFCTRS
jgi:hypothetical protein